MNNQAAIEYIVCFPHNQFRFKYKINDGGYHYIDKYKAYTFFSQYINNTHYILLQKLLSSFLPFIIIPNEEDIFELKKIDELNETFQEKHLTKMSEQELMIIKNNLQNENFNHLDANKQLISEIETKYLKL